jgi:hypothetical protein
MAPAYPPAIAYHVLWSLWWYELPTESVPKRVAQEIAYGPLQVSESYVRAVWSRFWWTAMWRLIRVFERWSWRQSIRITAVTHSWINLLVKSIRMVTSSRIYDQSERAAGFHRALP